MIINIEHYHRDVTYKGLKTYLSFGKIGICCLENGKRTMPSFDCVIFSDKCVFVEANGLWGILDSNLCLIAPPIYKEIFPVNRIDRDSYISSCMTNQDTVSLTLNSNSSIPTHIAIQTKEIDTDKMYDKYGEGLLPSFYHNNIDYEDKARVYEINNDLESAETDLFVTISDEGNQLINIAELEIKHYTGFRGDEFFLLWHYKENMFIIRNNNGTYLTSTYKNGRFAKKSLWGEFNDGFDEEGSPQIVIHRGEFVSVCYPRSYRITGFPNTKQFQEKENAFHEKSGKWALFKYHHTKIEEDDKGWHKHFSNEDTCFEQLTSFVFEEYATQLQNENEFICHGDDMDFLMRFEHNGNEICELTKVDEKYETKSCSQGHLNIIACYDSIEPREDGLLDVTTKEGYGLCDQNMKVVVPAKYDYPIEWGEQIIIVAKNDKYGAINNLGEEIVPCKYEYIQVGKGDMQIWDWDCEWDNRLADTVDTCSINQKVEIIPSNDDLIKEGYIIVGVTLEKAKIPEQSANPTTVLDKLKNFTARVQKPRILATLCDVYLPNGKLIANCAVGKLGIIKYSLYEGILFVSDRTNSVNSLKQYGIYVNKSSAPVLKSNELSDNIHSLSGNSSEGFCDLEEIIITKYVGKVEWNGLGRCRFRKFSVEPENHIFCEVDGVLYTQKGYNRKGETNKKHMIELVACPTNVLSHDVVSGTKRIANCAFKGTKIETLNLPDTLEEIGVNAFYHTPNLKYIKLPKSIRKIEAQDVGKSGDSSPRIEYDAHSFDNWASLYEYMLRNGFDKRNGNITKTRI